MTFSYAPRSSHKNLLIMSDDSSCLYLDGATLYTTNTGMRLATGSLYFDNYVTVSSQARSTGEAIEFSTDLNIQGLSGALLDIFGIIKYV